MAHYRDPKTAPRNGTIVIGLFERAGKRAIAKLAAFDVEAAKVDVVEPHWPAWQREAAERQAARDPLWSFRPLNEEDDIGTGNEVGRFIGWRPARPYKPST